MVIFCCANELKMRSTGRERIVRGGKEGQEREGGWERVGWGMGIKKAWERE